MIMNGNQNGELYVNTCLILLISKLCRLSMALVFSLLRLSDVLISTCVVGMSDMIRGGVWMSDIGITRRGSGDELY